MGRVISFFPLKIFCLTVPQNFVGTINVSENFGYRKILRIRRGYHYSTLNFFASQGQKNLPFEKILVSNIFMHRRGHHGFVETFLFHMTEKLQMRPFCVSEIFSFGKKFMDNRWGVYQVIPSKLFLSHSAEKICDVTLCFRKFLVWVKIYGGEMGGIIFFRRKFFCLTVPKNSAGEPFNVSKKLGFRKNLCIRRANHYFPLNLFGLTVPKKICLSKKF